MGHWTPVGRAVLTFPLRQVCGPTAGTAHHAVAVDGSYSTRSTQAQLKRTLIDQYNCHDATEVLLQLESAAATVTV